MLRLQRTDRAHADNPRHLELFHRPDIRAMIQFRWQDSMSPPMTWQEHDVPTAQPTGQKIIRWLAERRFYFHPFLIGEAFDMIQPAAADNSDAMTRHARSYIIPAKWSEANVEG